MSDYEKKPTLSIIVPVYNVECFLKRCIESILNQDFDDFELILVNDGSPDNSGKICEQYSKSDKRIKYIYKKNGGLGSARNYGLSIAKGEYIGFVDSDDWITNDMYSFLINQAVKYNSDIVSASYMLTSGRPRINQKNYYVKCFEGNSKIRYYIESGMKHRVADYSVCNKIYKKNLFDKIQFPEGQLYEDVITNLNLIKLANKYVKSNKITYFYFQDSNSITRDGFRLKDYDLLLVGKQMVEFANKEKDPYLINLAKSKEARAYFSMLTKIAIYGFHITIENKTEIINDLTKKLRSNYVLLIKSYMPLNRKVLMTLLCIDIRIVEVISKMYINIRNTIRA